MVYDDSSRTFGDFRKTEIYDTAGHGTFIAGLVLEHTRDAILYVANVSNQSEPDVELLARVSH